MGIKKIFFVCCSLFCAAWLYAQQTQQLQQKANLPTPKINTTIRQAAPPEKVSFFAIINHQQTAPRSPLKFDEVSYNDGNGFADNAFVAPTAGLYSFSIHTNWSAYGCQGGGGSASVYALINGRGELPSVQQPATPSTIGGFSAGLTFTTKLKAGDKVTVHVVNILCTNGTGTQAILYRCYFSGYRVYPDAN